MISYFPQKCIISELPISKRRILARHTPSIRTLNRRCGLSIRKAIMKKENDKVIIEIDTVVWELENGRVTLPSSRTVQIPSDYDFHFYQLLQQFSDYYFNRQNSRIQDFVWHEVICDFEDFHVIKVSNLFVAFESFVEYNALVFIYFQGLKFRKMTIVNSTEDIFKDLKENSIEVDDLEVFIDDFEKLPELEDLPLTMCKLSEMSADIRKIADTCKDFAFIPIGYTYRAIYNFEDLYSLPISAAWTIMNDVLHADIKYTDGIRGHCHSIDNDKEMFIITKKYSFNPILQNSYEAFMTLQEAGKSVTYQEMCIADKLIYFKLKWDNIQLDWSTRFGIFLAHLLRVPIARIPSEPINESSRSFRIVNGVFTFLSYCHVYNLPIFTIILQIIITFFIYFHFLINFPDFLITLGLLLLISVSFAALDVFLFPWKSYPERISRNSTQILCPFG